MKLYLLKKFQEKVLHGCSLGSDWRRMADNFSVQVHSTNFSLQVPSAKYQVKAHYTLSTWLSTALQILTKLCSCQFLGLKKRERNPSLTGLLHTSESVPHTNKTKLPEIYILQFTSIINCTFVCISETIAQYILSILYNTGTLQLPASLAEVQP